MQERCVSAGNVKGSMAAIAMSDHTVFTHDVDEAVYLADRVLTMSNQPVRINRQLRHRSAATATAGRDPRVAGLLALPPRAVY